MAFRRQGLTQRRKAVGFTQESLAEHLGVERSTVIRWEAGDSEPLPSIRPSLARALQVSIDQLAELITESDDVDTLRPPSADTGGTAPVLPPEVLPAERPGGPELDSPIHPQLAETVEALRRALRSAGVSAEDLAAMLLVGGSSRVPLGAPASDVPEPLPTELPNPSAPAAIPPDIEPAEVQRRRASSPGCKRFAAAALFVLVLPAVWLSPPFGFSPGGAGARESAVPVFAGPAPNPGSRTGTSPRLEDSPGDVNAAPPVTPASGPAASPAAVAVPAPRTTRATGNSRTSHRSTRPAVPDYPPSSREWLRRAAAASDHWNDVGQIERIDRLW